MHPSLMILISSVFFSQDTNDQSGVSTQVINGEEFIIIKDPIGPKWINIRQKAKCGAGEVEFEYINALGVSPGIINLVVNGKVLRKNEIKKLRKEQNGREILDLSLLQCTRVGHYEARLYMKLKGRGAEPVRSLSFNVSAEGVELLPRR